jgi:serine protease DegS
MNKLINFIIWPAVAGLVFGFMLLQLPRLAEVIPGLNAFLPPQTVPEDNRFTYSFSDAIAKTAPAVVSINFTADVARKVNPPIFDPFRGNVQFYEGGEETSSLGSGVIISPDGYIITSFHIFQLQDPDLIYESPFPEITVTLYDGSNVEARILAVEEHNDLALLKIDAENLAYLMPAEENTLDVGDIVLAIGNPRNIGQSVTQGIISALLRTADSYVIQTDAAINPGSSGGALVDLDGKLVGINSTIVSESGGSEGISFAVPARLGQALMQAYIDQGPGGYLGVNGGYISRIIGRMILDLDTQGLWVEQLDRNGAAEKAGLQPNDVIVSINDIEIISLDTAEYAIQYTNNMSPGETVIARVFRNGEILTFPIVLGVGEAFLLYTEDELFLDPDPFKDGLLR